MRSAPSLSLDFRPSRLAQAALVGMLLLVIVSIGISALPFVAQIPLGLAVAAFGLLALRALRRPVVRRVVLQSDGLWLLDTRDGEVTARLHTSSLLGSLIGLQWRDVASGRDISVLLWPDTIGEATRRPLRIWLRSGRALRVEAEGDS